MAAKAFVDTNVLLRAQITAMDKHAACDVLIKAMLQDSVDLWINGQVIREFIVQVTHPRTLAIPLTIAQVDVEISVIKTVFQVADETRAVRDKLIELLKTYPALGKQVHDTNLVATMIVNGIDTLLTLNVADFKRFDDKIKIITLPQTT